MLTGLRTGTLDMSVNSHGPVSSVVPELAAFGLPFLFADSQAAYRVIDGAPGQEIARKLEAVGLISLGWWDNGIRHITNSKRPINRPEDLRGLKIRTPADPATIDTFQALGAATQQINFGELYVALQQGVVDGQENPLANIQSAKLHEVNRFISLTSHKWECSPFVASRIAWGRLTRPTAASSPRSHARRPSTTAGSWGRATPSCWPSTAPTRPFRSTRRTAAVPRRHRAGAGPLGAAADRRPRQAPARCGRGGGVTRAEHPFQTVPVPLPAEAAASAEAPKAEWRLSAASGHDGSAPISAIGFPRAATRKRT